MKESEARVKKVISNNSSPQHADVRGKILE
jgi:hypothetical protein